MGRHLHTPRSSGTVRRARALRTARGHGGGHPMIYGTALLALCYLAGIVLGDWRGMALGARTNVGGVGIAMLLLVTARLTLHRFNRLQPSSEAGIHYWGGMYIPVVVAMAAQQDVVKALSGGWIAIIAAIGSVIACAGLIAVINRTEPSHKPAPELEDALAVP